MVKYSRQLSLISSEKDKINKNDIFVSKEYWKSMNIKELEAFANKILRYYRQNGFPYYMYKKYQKIQIFNELKKFNVSNLLENDIIHQTMHGLNLAWSYFPHAWNIRCSNMKTPMEIFNDDILFKQAIQKRLKFYDNISDSGIRKILRIFSGTQSVSNFRPTAAKCIYEYFSGNGHVWDMSAGFGGRLLGALASPKIKHYIGTDPSHLTYEGLCKIRDDFAFVGKKIELHKIGSEDFIPKSESIDLCFSSPPYFDTEKYSDEPTQSYIKFPSKNSWMINFLMKTVDNCFLSLKKKWIFDNKYFKRCFLSKSL